MATISTLMFSLSSLSLSTYQLSQKPCTHAYFSRSPNSAFFSQPASSFSFRRRSSVVVSAALEEAPPGELEESADDVDESGPPEPYVTPIAPATPAEIDAEDIMKYTKSRLPGGFAAQTIIGTGRRKCSIARVVLLEGNGKLIINYRDGKEYLQGNPYWIEYARYPLMVLGYEHSYDIFVKAHGGGLAGQAQAISLGVARALLKVSEEHRRPLRGEGLLTRDSRIVERKKAGLKKARKAPQYSKR